MLRRSLDVHASVGGAPRTRSAISGTLRSCAASERCIAASKRRIASYQGMHLSVSGARRRVGGMHRTRRERWILGAWTPGPALAACAHSRTHEGPLVAETE